MRQGFRPLLVAPSHRRVTRLRRVRPIHCLVVTFVAILFVIVIFGVSAWSIFDNKFGDNKFNFFSGDEVALSEVANDFSITFCDRFEVSASQGHGQAYLLPHHATVNTTFLDNTFVEIHQLPYREFNVRYVYLLKKSSVNVTACRNNAPVSPDAEIVLIQGDRNFKKWRRNSYCSDCVLTRTRIPSDAYCYSRSIQLPRLYQEIEENDKYFLVIFNGQPGHWGRLVYSGIFLHGFFSRTHFDLSDAEKVCVISDASSCVFDLPWSSSKDVVIRFKETTRKNYQDNFFTQCHKRVIFWVCLFGISPLFCILVLISLYGCFKLRKRAKNSNITRCYIETSSGEKTPLLPNGDRHTNMIPQNEENGAMAIQFT